MKPWDWFIQQIRDPVKWRRLNGWMFIFWVAMFVVSILTGWVSNLIFISVLSLYANVATHLGIWAASRAEAKAEENSPDSSNG